MSFKTIAVHLDDGPRCAMRVALAARLARASAAASSASRRPALPDVILTMNSAVPDGARDASRSRPPTCASRPKRRRGRSTRNASALDVASFEAAVVVEEAVDAMVRHGRCSDLIVVGQTDRHRADRRRRIRLPAAGPAALPARRSSSSLRRDVRLASASDVLVAWKGTREAATRAARRAAAAARRAARVALVEVGRRHGPMPRGDDSLAGRRRPGSNRTAIAFDAHREIDLAGVGEQLLSRASPRSAPT